MTISSASASVSTVPVPGSTAPDFSLENQFGEVVSLAEVLEKTPVVLVFFPLAFTGICTQELCELRDNLALFEHAGATLLGVSVDSKATLRAFADREGYEFSLLADFWPHGEVARQYGVFRDDRGIATRGSFVIGQDGRIVSSFVNEPGQARSFEEYQAALALLGS
ncbi:peroxiredoxin [Ruicaihuangia caeni]|uniref:Alkyl hydroperoxide reductase E n=1 Tax=Ruicaihuangia caeni TaxID=3042517 RepID=A0AAW6T8K8_9MICO|nr:peroxiredoxin [Klugiella sp. YN-L-19]MDI2097977.1 peroxiredoxin [Klugiella sp. YN-L-19]